MVLEDPGGKLLTQKPGTILRHWQEGTCLLSVLDKNCPSSVLPGEGHVDAEMTLTKTPDCSTGSSGLRDVTRMDSGEGL